MKLVKRIEMTFKIVGFWGRGAGRRESVTSGLSGYLKVFSHFF